EDGNRFGGPRFEGCVCDGTLLGALSSKPEVNQYLSQLEDQGGSQSEITDLVTSW
ncbi:hypothetical protein FRC00_011485, partial [Tulasnella sp. 408]